MSHIPNSAMPHAGPSAEAEKEGGGSRLSKGAGKLAEKARKNPKTAVAAGAVVAGAIAAAAIPLVKARKKSGTSGSGGGAKKKSTKSGGSSTKS